MEYTSVKVMDPRMEVLYVLDLYIQITNPCHVLNYIKVML